MAVLTIFSSAGDGYVSYQGDNGESFASVQSTAAGNSLNYTGTEALVSTLRDDASNFYKLTRTFLPFDTSSLPDDCTINSAVLYVYGSGKINQTSDSDSTLGINLYEGQQASTSVLANSDYSLFGATALASPISYPNFVTGAYNAFTLNATGLALISKTGYTKYCLRESYDVSATTPQSGHRDMSFYNSEATGTSTDPKLVIDYTSNTTTSTSSSTSTTVTTSSTSTTLSSTSTTSTTRSTSTTTTSTSTTSTTSSTSTTTTSTTTTSSSTTTTSSSTTMPFSIAVDNV